MLICSGEYVQPQAGLPFGFQGTHESNLQIHGVNSTFGTTHPFGDGQKGVSNAIISISIFVHDVTLCMAPLKLWSRLDGKLFIGTGLRGSILMRCVDTIHAGSENRSTCMRVLPAFRFFTPEALRHGWEPDKFIPERIYQKFPSPLATKCIFLRALPQPSMPVGLSNDDGSSSTAVLSSDDGFSALGASNDGQN